MSKNRDIRIIKTKRAIKNALFNLIELKGFEAITINEISRIAEVNRSTFYLHYADKYELLDKVTHEAIMKLETLVCHEREVHGTPVQLEVVIKDLQVLFDIVRENALFYKAILGHNGIPSIRMKIVDYFKKRLEESLLNDSLIPKEILLELTSSIYVDTISWWINNDLKYSSMYMAEYLAKYLSLGAVKIANSKEVVHS